MATLSLGILAHVDAGKTSLTERLLFAAGVIDEIGRVDDGTTQTDTLELERRRGITIRSAVVSFPLRGVTVNLIDTPGHPDFIAEVERVLGVLDGAVLVVSAVEGVQAQTRVLARTLHRLRIPTLIFVNKVDRAGARDAGVLDELAARISPAIVPMSRVGALGTRAATVRPAVDLLRLADHDDAVLAALVEDRPAPPLRVRDRVHPVYFGSAVTGAGIDDLIDGITRLLPPAASGAASDDGVRVGPRPAPAASGATSDGAVRVGRRPAPAASGAASDGAVRVGPRPGSAANHVVPAAGDPTAVGAGPGGGRVRDRGEALAGGCRAGGASPAWTVFKVERGSAGEKLAYLRMFAGTLRVRDQVGGDRVTGIEVFAGGGVQRRAALHAGEIGRVRGLAGVRIGDSSGVQPKGAQFAPPSLETAVVAGRRGELHAALAELAEQDPLINLRQDDERQQLYVSLYGEVQKEVLQATLAEQYGIAVRFERTVTLCVERLAGVGEAVEFNKVAPNPFLATVGLRLEPGAAGAGVSFGLAVEPGAMPAAFFAAVEHSVRVTLRQGLRGWPVPDCAVTLTHSGYSARQSHAHAVFDKSMSSTAGDFRGLTPLVVMAALRRAGTVVQEPVHAFRIDAPADTVAALLPVLARLGAVPLSTGASGVDGEIPAARVDELRRRLPGLTRGEGVLDAEFDHYAPVRGPAPARPRTGPDPLDRKEYLIRVVRRAGAKEDW